MREDGTCPLIHPPLIYPLIDSQCATIAVDSDVAVYFAPDQTSDIFAGQQGEIVPACRVEPSNPEDVAYVLKKVKEAGCHFAIRSGGHSVWPGASNADGGITISLRRIGEVLVSPDCNTVKLGSGLQWVEAYNALEGYGLNVVGGRAGTVGVGGLLLGGKLSVRRL
jgi:FAD/FMN-containing dehydrogenase